MARWTGSESAADVLAAADVWRDQCFLTENSVFSDAQLWTRANLEDLARRMTQTVTEGNFHEKFKEQLTGAPASTIQLAAEINWFYLLFPSDLLPATKSEQVRNIWSWSAQQLPDDTYLQDRYLRGVGGVGRAYQSRRPEEIAFLLRVMLEWRALPPPEREMLLNSDVPWEFVAWLDALPNASRRPMRHALLYFLFPDHLERNVSRAHRERIVSAFKSKLPSAQVPSSDPTHLELDRAIAAIRSKLSVENGTNKLDFYRSPLQEQWSWVSVKEARGQIASTITAELRKYGLELRQCGQKKQALANCGEVDVTTGFWAEPGESTNKPLRWIVHLDASAEEVSATLAQKDGALLHGAKRIAFANTAQGNSGAVTVRVIPAIRTGTSQYAFVEEWEWLLLLCFFPALTQGSSGQLLEDFDPANGSLVYKGKAQKYIFASLIALNVPDASFSFENDGRPTTLTYNQATIALSRMIRVETKAKSDE